MNELEQLRVELQYGKTNKCVQCGYCLPVCPTYVTMGKETHSPRGRINLIKMVGEGKITDLSLLEEPLDLCLGCRACETACPTGVEYGSILESARAAITKRRRLSVTSKVLKRTFLRKIFPSRKMMHLIGNSIWVYQKSGVQNAVRKFHITNKLPYHLGDFEATVTESMSPKERRQFQKYMKARGERKYTVAFFTGCIMDAMFARVNQLSVELLAYVGCDVTVVEGQTCCGALHAHAGELEQARWLAKRNIVAFEHLNVDFVVNNAGGCGAMLYEYDHLLEDEKDWHERAKKFVSKSTDISKVLSLCGGVPFTQQLGNRVERVTYQPSCHLTNVQRIIEEPLELLKSVPNAKLIALQSPDTCCGSAGIYNIVHYDESMDILNRKMEDVKEVQPTIIVTSNPGCLIQMKLGIEREKLKNIRALHLVEYLAEAAGIS
ncbi:(Fe-S)-binding protein [Alicyclobacillus cycloheptanicus]|uniref:Glycolate oxidase iron-sulfur subunit n=1 Tax=Alicyclobacillus cycloheptanicus TaxID=1457 RepID=A0ABT9XHP2_9BACL|nr:(Fe-S)-binding protein [Alicyclobacillus cycloheptanicus]MDQ0189810.1 glycolate oxidase iron-sulfur subunit [Alicyclobacillus cycloheptanicus]WDM02499.1 (Fe-S)-binding protein [Alicyclobacillus cycloheptanicus]